jgi:hypothetical protein
MSAVLEGYQQFHLKVVTHNYLSRQTNELPVLNFRSENFQNMVLTQNYCEVLCEEPYQATSTFSGRPAEIDSTLRIAWSNRAYGRCSQRSAWDEQYPLRASRIELVAKSGKEICLLVWYEVRNMIRFHTGLVSTSVTSLISEARKIVDSELPIGA